MGNESGTRRGAVVALVVALCLVAANMRPTITAVGPLLEEIGEDTGMAIATLGFITSVPLIAWGVVSPLAHGLSRRFGMSRVVLWSLILLLAGTVVRSLPGPTASLWLGTALIGIALAIANVLMPAAVKRDFPGRVPVMMSVYTALLGGVGAVASGVAVPISQAVDNSADGWRVSLLVTGGALLPFAIVAWAWAHRGTHPVLRGAPRVRHRPTGIWTDAVAWQVAGYMAFQSATFYMVVTWLATISTSIGRSPVVAGFDVMVYQLLSLAGSLLLPLLLRGRAERFIPALIPLLGITATVGLMVAPQWILVWAVVMGLFSGSSLAMALTLIAQRARDHEASSALSGMSQAVGYLFAAIGPVAFGWLHATVGGWVTSLGLLLLVMVGQAATGLLAGRDRYVLEPR
ncbi:MAG: hypothetical protein K0S05_674 [Agromyces sp.]|jgi:CP family cyanate transporter-like MFS transporter|nr:hypothetical protein [Agromyces sp.]